MIPDEHASITGDGDPFAVPAMNTADAALKVQEQVWQASRELEQLRGLLHGAFETLRTAFIGDHAVGRSFAADADAALADSAHTLSAFQVQDMSDQLVVHISKRMRLVDLVLQRGSTDDGSELFADPACPVAVGTLDFGSVELF